MEKLKLLLCLIGIHDWEYGYDMFDNWKTIKKQEPYHKERRCERCGKHQLRYPIPPDWDGPLGKWETI